MSVSDAPVQCDIAVIVCNGLARALGTLESVLEYTPGIGHRLIVVDDGSDAVTASRLREMARRQDRLRLIRNPERFGLEAACVQAGEAGGAPFFVLVQSGVMVTPGWLERLTVCALSDPRIASARPWANRGSSRPMAMLPGANYFGMSEILARQGALYPDTEPADACCVLFRREALERIRFFGPGRSKAPDGFDLWRRLDSAGYRAVVADDLYVYNGRELGLAGDQGAEGILDGVVPGRRPGASRRLGVRRQAERRFPEKKLPITRRGVGWGERERTPTERHVGVRSSPQPTGSTGRRFPEDQLRTLIRYERRWDLLPSVWETARAMMAAARARRPLALVGAALSGLMALPRARVPRVTPQDAERVVRPGRLRVTYILHRLVVAGGVLSVIQLVNELIRLGVEARIVTLFEDPAVHRWMPLYTRPILFRDEQELIRSFPPSDVVVATLWTTAPWARTLVDAGRAAVGVYFLQDYEPWFFPADDGVSRARVQETYGLLPSRIVKSDWLAGMLRSHGYATHKIALGMDLGRFYRRDVGRGRPTLLAMARPGTPRRGFAATIRALSLVKSRRPDVEIRLFGDSALRRQRIPFAYRDEGVVTDIDHMAQLYSSADVFLDGSEFQGFGRCGLEAMACGTACVLTDVGGVNEYASQGVNALLVPPSAPERFAEAILSLLDDEGLRARLTSAGLATAQRFCHRREARETLAYVQSRLPVGTCQ